MPPATTADSPWPFRVGLLLVAVAAVTSAEGVFRYHAEHERGLWVSPSHDRHAHYRFGHQLAADVRTGDAARFASDLDKGSIVWTPLHGVLLAIALLAGDNHPTMAVVPSLVAWAAGAVFAYLAANRAVRRFGPLAGVVTAAFVLGNPTFRAYAADCMLESLGGCLTFAVLHAYLRWEQDRTGGSAACLGLALSLLFFEKLNYWLLAALACGTAHLLANRAEWWAMLRRCRGDIAWRAWLLAQPLRPLNYPIIALAALTAFIRLTGGFEVTLDGKCYPFHGTGTLVTIVYALVLLRLTVWWWVRGGRHAVRAWLGNHRYPLAYWHLAPVLVWFLIPLRIPNFVWFLSPANRAQAEPTFPEAVASYWRAFSTEYAPGAAYTWVALGLAGVATAGVVIGGAYRRTGWVVPLYAGLTVALTVGHPNQHPRYFFTAAAGLWLAAGAGAAVLASLAGRWHRVAALTTAGVLLAASGWVVYPHLTRPEAAVPRGAGDGSVSLRDLTDPYLSELPPDATAAVFGTHPSKFWAEWSWMERGRRTDRLAVDYRDAGPYGPASAELFAHWCAVTRCGWLVFVDIEPGGLLDEPSVPDEGHAVLRDLLPTQDTFVLDRSIRVHGRGTVSIWRRTASH